MSDLCLSGLSVAIRIAENSISTITTTNNNDPALVIIFADPATRNLEQLLFFDKQLFTLIIKILAAKADEDQFECQHLIKSSLMLASQAENILKEEEEQTDDSLLKEEEEKNGDRDEEEEESDMPTDPQNDPSDEEESLSEEKEPGGKILLTDRGHKLAWPFTKVSSNKFLCDICNRVFTNSSNVRAHIRTHGLHTQPEGERTCPHCGRVFDTALLCRKHHRERVCKAAQRPQCVHCRQDFASAADLKVHQRTESHAAVVDKLRCTYCDFVAGSRGSLTMHQSRRHLNLFCRSCKQYFKSAEEKTRHAATCSSSTTLPPPELAQCDQCEKAYSRKQELVEHIENVHQGRQFPCGRCESVLSNRRALIRHIRVLHEVQTRELRCDQCGKAFKDKDTLNKHFRTHAGYRSDPCPECGKQLANRDKLHAHIKVVHRKTEHRHVCYDCGKTFPYPYVLAMHKETVHLKGDMLVCSICGKEVLGRLRLADHMSRSHARQPPPPDSHTAAAACHQCGQEMPAAQLRSHMVEAHKVANYRFQCDRCSKRFDKRALIRNHYRETETSRLLFHWYWL